MSRLSVLQKSIIWFGRNATLACDGRCDKAWGISNRPQLFYQGTSEARPLAVGEEPSNPDDYVFVPDSQLGTAPACPGTWEGGDGKPSAAPLQDASLINKWCARECERSTISENHEPIAVPNLERPKPNMPNRNVPW